MIWKYRTLLLSQHGFNVPEIGCSKDNKPQRKWVLLCFVFFELEYLVCPPCGAAHLSVSVSVSPENANTNVLTGLLQLRPKTFLWIYNLSTVAGSSSKEEHLMGNSTQLKPLQSCNDFDHHCVSFRFQIVAPFNYCYQLQNPPLWFIPNPNMSYNLKKKKKHSHMSLLDLENIQNRQKTFNCKNNCTTNWRFLLMILLLWQQSSWVIPCR